jgi:hypothetical protein
VLARARPSGVSAPASCVKGIADEIVERMDACRCRRLFDMALGGFADGEREEERNCASC